MKVGKVYPPYSADNIFIAVNKDIIDNGTPVLGRYLKLNFKRNNKECVAVLRVVDLETGNNRVTTPGNVLSIEDGSYVEKDVKNGDILTIKCEALTAFEKTSRGYKRVPLDTVIPSLTEAEFVTKEFIDELIGNKKGVFYMGKSIDECFDVPFVFKSFYELNESYHMIIAGQTGSGKSTEAKKMLIGYLVGDKEAEKRFLEMDKKYRRMSFLILDPVGEFSNAFQGKGKRDAFNINARIPDIWQRFGREKDIKIIDINDIIMDDWDMLWLACYSGVGITGDRRSLLKTIGIKHYENRRYATDLIISFMKEKTDGKITNLKEKVTAEDIIEYIISNVNRIYTNNEKREEIRYIRENENAVVEFENIWNGIVERFSRTKPNKRTISEILNELLSNKENAKRTVVINLAGLKWDNPFKYAIISRLFYELKRRGTAIYQSNDDDILNTLVVIDEAHRIVPNSISWVSDITLKEQIEKAKNEVITAYRETRKFGIGWMIISTRISNLDKEIWEHSRVKLFGFGLSTGKDADIIREQYGREILELYKEQITDPYDLMGDRKHSFMLDGPVCLLSRKTPEFYTAYGDVDEFLEKNGVGKEEQNIAEMLNQL